MRYEPVNDEKLRETIVNNTKLINAAHSMLCNRNLPNSIFYKMMDNLKDYLFDVTEFCGSMRVYEHPHNREFIYGIVIDSGEKMVINLKEIRTDLVKRKVETYIDKYSITIQDGKAVVDATLRLDENNPDNIRSHRIYVNPQGGLPEATLEEFLSDNNNQNYTDEEVDFIQNLAEVIDKTEMFERALKESWDYTYVSQKGFYLYFGFGKGKSVLGYNFSLSNKNYFVSMWLSGDVVKLLIKDKNTEEHISYEDFIKDLENQNIIQKTMEIVDKLNELGITIECSETKTR